MHKRIVWKDSKPKLYKPVKYRDHMIYGSPEGWTTTLPGDQNLYANHYAALNAIDAALGNHGRRGKASRKREAYGIQIIGKRTDAS